MKNNPLFVDSTRFRGEMIVAEIEVIGVELDDGESLVTKIIMKDGRAQAVKLEHTMGLRYAGSIRLAYQEELTIRHCVFKEEEVIDQTPEKKFVVNYTNLQRWDRRLPEKEIEEPAVEATSPEELSEKREALIEAMTQKARTISDLNENSSTGGTSRPRSELYEEIKKELKTLEDETPHEASLSQAEDLGWSRPIPNMKSTSGEIEIEPIDEPENLDSSSNDEIDL